LDYERHAGEESHTLKVLPSLPDVKSRSGAPNAFWAVELAQIAFNKLGSRDLHRFRSRYQAPCLVMHSLRSSGFDTFDAVAQTRRTLQSASPPTTRFSSQRAGQARDDSSSKFSAKEPH
jgi:hypothetical protein